MQVEAPHQLRRRIVLRGPTAGNNCASAGHQDPGAARAPGRPESPIRLSACVIAAVSVLAACFFAASAHATTASWSLSPPTYDFGTVAMGARSTPATFTLINTGESDLSAPRVDLEFERPEDYEGQESGIFEDSAFDCAVRADLKPGESCAVTLTFQPANRGPRNGTIRFVDPGSELSPAAASFSGLGIGPIVSFSPLRNLTAAVNEGPSQPQVLTVANDGDADLSISGISLIGDNASHFAIVGQILGNYFIRKIINIKV